MNKEVGMLLTKTELIQNNNYCEDIYIPPYNKLGLRPLC